MVVVEIPEPEVALGKLSAVGVKRAHKHLVLAERVVAEVHALNDARGVVFCRARTMPEVASPIVRPSVVSFLPHVILVLPDISV